MALFVGSAWLVATTSKVPKLDGVYLAVLGPVETMLPGVVPLTIRTLHDTLVLVVPLTVAVNVVLSPGTSS